MEDKLEKYLREANRTPATSRPKRKKEKPTGSTRESAFKRWAASAAMDLFKVYMPLLMTTLSGGLCLIVAPSAAIYFFCAAGVILVFGSIFCAYDFYHFSSWSSKLDFKLEGWSSVIHSRSPKYWDMNGEHWVPVKVVITMNEVVNEKHIRVLEAFLKKLQRRLNQWTVSKEQPFGYSQPNGWAHDGLILAGEINPRALNLIRKRFSGELNGLSKLMPGSIAKVTISANGEEKYHKVYVDSSD